MTSSSNDQSPAQQDSTQQDSAKVNTKPGITDLTALLDLTSKGVDNSGQDLFEGVSSNQPHGRVFGGQVLAQAVTAAMRTVHPDRGLHSMHGYFLRPGDLNVPITFCVERLRDGRSFTARRVHAMQHDQPILSMIASFQVANEGLDHGAIMPNAPLPEALPSTQDLMQGVDHAVARYWADERPIDIRHADQPLYFKPADGETDRQIMWLKSRLDLPDDDRIHRAVLAYASDYALLESVLRRHGLAWATPGLKAASLDHAMWWHRPFRADEWLLCVQDSPSASGARGLARAKFFTRDGEHVATAAQELMVRVPLKGEDDDDPRILR